MNDTKTPAKRYTAIAVMITAGLLAVALVVLIVSSIAFAAIDSGSGDASAGGSSGEGDFDGGATGGTVTYSTVTKDALDKKLSANLVSIRSNRTEFAGGGDSDQYYASTTSDKLTPDAQKALDTMLIAFYEANKEALVTNTGSDDCNIPYVTEAKDGATFIIKAYDEESDLSKTTYKWIYDNASKYGFIYSGNKFTYVGVAVASYMKTSSLTSVSALVENLKGRTGNVSISAVAVGATKATSYQIYYVSTDGELKAPSNYEYSVIAGGTNGYVIVVDMSKKIAVTTPETSAAG